MLSAAMVSRTRTDRYSISSKSSRDQDEKKMDDGSVDIYVHQHQQQEQQPPNHHHSKPVESLPTFTALTGRRPLIHVYDNVAIPHKEASRVHFGIIDLHYHAITVGVNPGSTELGSAPLELDWKRLEEDKISVDEFEMIRKPERRRASMLKVSPQDRRERLMNDWGIPGVVVDASVRVADEIRLERATSYHSRPKEEVEALDKRMRYAKEQRRLHMVKLRQEKYAKQKAERKQQIKAEAQQKKESKQEGRRRTLRGLFGR